MSIGKKIAIAAGAAVAAVVIIVGGYVAYVSISYYRIGDVTIQVEGTGTSTTAKTGTTYSIATYNIGFGAYQQNYACVLDTAYVKDSSGNWTTVSGTNLKALSATDAENNTKGAANTLKNLDTDFIFVQEADTNSDRCYGLNQVQIIKNELSGYANTYALNFHTPYLVYPFNDMMGHANSGILTLSRFAIQNAKRYEFTVTDDFVSKQFDLDRCFSANYVDVENGHQLILVNVHMSAYDEGGKIRAQQRDQLYSFIAAEYEKGNYVVVGGDFNHDLLTNNPDYPQYTADNLAFGDTSEARSVASVVAMFDEDKSAGLPTGFKIIASDNWPSCRNAATTWDPETSEIWTLDGFIVSDNVRVVSHRNIETTTDQNPGFAYSDHEPAYMEFVLE